MHIARRVGRFLIDTLKCYAMYLLVVVAGTGLLMLIALSLGYLPYSDRPGPGWYGFHPNLSLTSLEFVANFVAFVSIFSVIFFVPVVIVIARLLALSRLPKILIAIVAAVSSAAVTFWLFVGAGWYIALEQYSVFAATALAAVYGAWILPGWPRKTRQDLPTRVAAETPSRNLV